MHGTLRCPLTCKENSAGISQPSSFGPLDSFKIHATELFPAMENIDVVAEGAIAPCYVGVLGRRQNPWGKPVKKIQTRIGVAFRMNLVSNLHQSALGEEKKVPLRSSHASDFRPCFLPHNRWRDEWANVLPSF